MWYVNDFLKYFIITVACVAFRDLYWDYYLDMEHKGPDNLRKFDGPDSFIKAGSKVLHYLNEMSGGRLNIRSYDKGQKTFYDCPEPKELKFPIRPLTVYYGITTSSEQWYAGEGRHYYPSPNASQITVQTNKGSELVNVYFHAIVFY